MIEENCKENLTSKGAYIIRKEKGKLEDVKEELREKIADKNYSDNSNTIEAKALKELREKYEFPFVDSDLKGDYERYVNYTVNQ